MEAVTYLISARSSPGLTSRPSTRRCSTLSSLKTFTQHKHYSIQHWQQYSQNQSWCRIRTTSGTVYIKSVPVCFCRSATIQQYE